MADALLLEREKFVALGESIQNLQGLLDGDSARLTSAQSDVVGRNDVPYILSMIVSELVPVVTDQAQRIETLEKELAKTTKAMKAMSKE
jgi:hypothetical protein